MTDHRLCGRRIRIAAALAFASVTFGCDPFSTAPEPAQFTRIYTGWVRDADTDALLDDIRIRVAEMDSLTGAGHEPMIRNDSTTDGYMRVLFGIDFGSNLCDVDADFTITLLLEDPSGVYADALQDAPFCQLPTDTIYEIKMEPLIAETG